MDGSRSQPMIEPLTERELEILKLISRGRSNRDIAQQLVLSLGTIKWYNRQIFSKLGVHNRAMAVTHARNAGLFEKESIMQPTAEILPPHNLPAQVTSFIGREKENRQIKQLLSTCRLVTLTGKDGSGKTRLALWVGRDILGDFQEGIIFYQPGSASEPEIGA